jgi:hypothetical protein
MSQTISPVSGKRYGLAVVCRVWRMARSAVYRHAAPPAHTGGRCSSSGNSLSKTQGRRRVQSCITETACATIRRRTG